MHKQKAAIIYYTLALPGVPLGVICPAREFKGQERPRDSPFGRSLDTADLDRVGVIHWT